MSGDSTRAGGPTRRRLIDVAIELFKRYSVAGTSLQMISDELGLTKSAIYHHFRTRDELLTAVMEPLIAEVAEIVDAAEEQRTPHARADHMLVGYASIAARHRTLIPLLSGDPGVVALLRTRSEWGDLVRRQLALFSEVEPGLGGQVKAALAMSGIASAAGVDYGGDVDDDTLRDQLIAAGRRALGLRNSRTGAVTARR
ncbi:MULTISPECIES: TetR/AcrR family transcriptional regulator [Mycolicibacterium]|uniref:TetR family transcriptional regulator n=2 Tax=Mycolicibacterium gilvum TaxID=1804 RepID=A0A378SWP9_9MYCO|nr:MULTISPECIES: TetR/AcrR family transcriptional regulator [Mycolicibacterium]ABP43457.1 transcriptional regulator, TetR family [Mycolicibacterium gilvum PYR-GCK]MBV5242288.1 TetR/AcrR family transcriptional regulator [Mycolicibacterium sp. PAM1]MCV7054061.1 TetR/AcrR family transcriptional regulator [Mycolicibacterium gilvum]STZ46326.1 TetR family transcriptional regulator [Mycolicibacterium gilvum]